MTAKHCLDCGEPFEAGRAPAASRPLRRLPPSRVAPDVAVTLYGGICGPCVTAESRAQAAPEGAGGAQAPNPAGSPAPVGALH